MKTNLIKAFYKTILLLVCLIGSAAYADPPCPPLDPDCVDAPPTEDAPIDANISILLLVAVSFGGYTIYTNNVNKKRAI